METVYINYNYLKSDPKKWQAQYLSDRVFYFDKTL